MSGSQTHLNPPACGRPSPTPASRRRPRPPRSTARQGPEPTLRLHGLPTEQTTAPVESEPGSRPEPTAPAPPGAQRPLPPRPKVAIGDPGRAGDVVPRHAPLTPGRNDTVAVWGHLGPLEVRGASSRGLPTASTERHVRTSCASPPPTMDGGWSWRCPTAYRLATCRTRRTSPPVMDVICSSKASTTVTRATSTGEA